MNNAENEMQMKQFEPPDIHHLRSAEGWLELGNHLEAEEELEKIAPRLREHPAVLSVKYDVHAKAVEWDYAAEIAGRLVKSMPDQPQVWLCLAYATRRKAGGGIPDAKQILIEAETKFPAEYLIRYNLACYECQLGNLKSAMKWLKKAIELARETDIRMMALRDPDLEPLRREIAGI
jgi:tetratricopeptide (TPR) repeat protein